MAKDLVFKLVLDAAVKDFIANTKQSKETVQAMFDEIRKQSQSAGQATEAASDGIDKVGQEAQESAKQVGQLDSSLDKANQELKETESLSDKAKLGFSNLKMALGALTAGLAAVGLGMTAKEFIGLSDATQQMNARLRNATDGVEDYNKVQGRMLELANATFRPLEEAQEVYLNTSGAMKALGYSTDETLDATDSLSLAFTANATSGEAAQSAQNALTGAMVKGRVDADAWASIMRATPNIAADLAKQTGKTTAEILKFGASGSISVRELTDTLIATRGANLDLANAMENSTADALQVVRNGVRNLVSDLNEQYNISSRLAAIIQDLGGDLSWLAPLFDDVMAAVEELSSNFDSIDPSIFTALKQAISAAYDAVKELVKAGYELGKDIFTILYDSINNAFAVLSSFTGEATEAGEQVSFLTRIGQGLSITFGAISDIFYGLRVVVSLLAGAFYDVAAAANRVMAAFTWGDVSKQFAANADAMKEKAKAYYKEANDLAMNAESQTKKRLDEAVESEEQKNARILAENKKALDELLAIQEEEGKNNDKLQSRKLSAVEKFVKDTVTANGGVLDSTFELELAQKGYYATVDEGGKVAVTRLTKQEQATAAATLTLKKMLNAFEQSKATGTELGIDVEKALNKVSAGFTDTGGKVQTFSQQLTEAKVSGTDAANMIYEAWQKWLDKAKNLAEVEEAKKKLKELGEEGKLAGYQVEQGLAAAENKAKDLNPTLNAAREAGKALGIDIDKTTNIMSQGFAATSGNIDTLKQKLIEANITGKEAANTLYAAWDAWLGKADSKVELDAAQAKLQEMAREGVISTKQLEEGMAAVKAKTEEVDMAADGTAEAFKRLGIQTKDALAMQAKQMLADFETVRQSGKATQADLQATYQKTITAAYASGDAAVIANANAQAASLGLAVQVDDTGKATVQSYAEMDRAAQSHKQNTDVVKQGYKEIGDAAEEAGEKAKAGAETSAKASKVVEDTFANDLFRRLAALDVEQKKINELGQAYVRARNEASYKHDGYGYQRAATYLEDYVKYLESLKERTERVTKATAEWDAKVNQAKASLESAMASAKSFQGSIQSINDEYLKATGQEDKLLQQRYTQRKQQLNLEYELLKVSIAKAKVEAQAAKLDTKPLDQALAEATKGFEEAKKQLIELEKMEKAKLEEQKKVDAAKKAEDAKKAADTSQSNSKADTTKPSSPTNAKPSSPVPQPPNININTSAANIDTPATKNVRIELSLGGQDVEVWGDSGSANALEAMMRELEQTKKRM